MGTSTVDYSRVNGMISINIHKNQIKRQRSAYLYIYIGMKWNSSVGALSICKTNPTR